MYQEQCILEMTQMNSKIKEIVNAFTLGPNNLTSKTVLYIHLHMNKTTYVQSHSLWHCNNSKRRNFF